MDASTVASHVSGAVESAHPQTCGILYILTGLPSINLGPEMSNTATLSSKFQISIPKAVREEFNWTAGQAFVFVPKDKGVLVMPVPELQDLAGIAQGARTTGYRDRKDRV
jgi:AbrB family looped-hinge helix DNA binding protein